LAAQSTLRRRPPLTEPAVGQARERSSQERPCVLFLALPSNESYADALVHPQHIGYRYLAAILRRNGYEARIVNIYLDEDELDDVFFSMDSAYVEQRLSAIIVRKTLGVVRALDVHPQVVGFSVTHRDAELVLRIADGLKSVSSDTTVLLGGVYASLCARELLSDNPQVDHILFGEAECSIIPYLRAVSDGGNLSGVPGLAWRAPAGDVVVNPPARVVGDLDDLPFPAEDEIQTIGRRNNDKLRISSSRGCHGRCAFCSINAFHQLVCISSVRARSPGSIVDEMEHLRDAYGIKCFVFVDPEFIGAGRRGQERAVKLAREIVRRKLDVRFKIDCRADGVDWATMSLLKNAGLYSVEIGVESFDNRTLRMLNKKVTRQQNISALRCLCALRLDVTMDYIFYTPWTTLETMKRELPVVKEWAQGPHIRLFPVFRPLKLIPHTEIINRAWSECSVRGDYRGYQYRLKDPRAHKLFLRHMAFCEKVRTLILNSPRVRENEAASSVTASRIVSEYHSLGWSLKMLTIGYIENLLSGDNSTMAEYEKRLNMFRALLMRTYSEHQLFRGRHSVALEGGKGSAFHARVGFSHDGTRLQENERLP
jgi:anaerobic magnesium-protoporphyrin IX monomethyl ester cyclase